jgi:hypothetical protein
LDERYFSAGGGFDDLENFGGFFGKVFDARFAFGDEIDEFARRK